MVNVWKAYGESIDMESAWSPHLFHDAFCFAAIAHNGQTLPGSDLPYLTHVGLVCTEVMAIATEVTDADLLVQCAALHDTLEDTDVTYDVLVGEFGSKVADGVLALTKDRSIAKDKQIDESLRRVRLQPREVWMVKMADRITNLYPPPALWSAERKISYREEAMEICNSLELANTSLAARLRERIREYAAYI